jgi:osmotically-inducible protein OsmY
MKAYATLFFVAAALAACARPVASSTQHTTAALIAVPFNGDPGAIATAPLEPGEDPQDRITTLAIRNAVMADESLSNESINIKIHAAKGVVTLRGPVISVAERKKLGEKAKAFAGTNRVENELAVETR